MNLPPRCNSIPLSWRNIVVTMIVGMIIFWIFLRRVCPSIYGGDSGEFAVTADVLGIPHAPGYPLYVLLGKTAIHLFPWANVAFRVNLLSAILAAAFMILCFFFLLKVTESVLAACAGCLCLLLSPILFDQAQVAEVFTLNVIFAVLLLGTALSHSLSICQSLYLTAFLMGLGLGNHHTLIFITPGLAWLFWKRMKSINLMPFILHHSSFIILFFLMGLSIYLYLPFRAAKHPAVNFNDPHTPHRFYSVVTRKTFGTLELHPAALPTRNLKSTWDQIQQIGGETVKQGGIALILALLGIWALRRNTLGWVLFLSWFLSGPFFLLFSNLSPHNTIAQWRLERFYLFPLLFLAVLAAFGAGWLLKKRKLSSNVTLGIFVFLFLIERSFADIPNFRYNLAFRDFGVSLVRQLEPRAILLIDRVMFDEPTSALMNDLLLEKRRSLPDDIRVIYRPGTLFELFYGEDYLELDDMPTRQENREKELWKSTRRPIYAMTLNQDALPAFSWTQEGLLLKRGGNVSYRSPSQIERYLFKKQHTDYPTRLITAHIPYLMGKSLLSTQKKIQARQFFQWSTRWGYDMEWLLSNIGSIWARQGDLEQAKSYYLRALEIDPYFPQTHFGLGYIFLQSENYALAAEHYGQAARLRQPVFADALYMHGVALYKAGRFFEASSVWKKFLEAAPDSPQAPSVRSELNQIHSGTPSWK